jgi:hypothetical protein
MRPEPTPYRQIRAVYDEKTITVYQAFRPAIAEAAVDAQTFVAPFKKERMTWVKPSFNWMMYRCGWGTKVDQERVLAVQVSREGFAWALEHACLSSAKKADVPEADWPAHKARHPVRIQWDPERDVALNQLEYRSIQMGLTGEAVHRYVDDWVVSIRDVTALAKQVYERVNRGELSEARSLLPHEAPYPTQRISRIGL